MSLGKRCMILIWLGSKDQCLQMLFKMKTKTKSNKAKIGVSIDKSLSKIFQEHQEWIKKNIRMLKIMSK